MFPLLTAFLNLGSGKLTRQVSLGSEKKAAGKKAAGTCGCGSPALEELSCGGRPGIHKGVQTAASPSDVLALPRGC